MRAVETLVEPLVRGDERIRTWCEEFGFNMDDVAVIEVCTAQGYFDGVTVHWYAKDSKGDRYLVYDANSSDSWSAAKNVTHLRVGTDRAKEWLDFHQVRAMDLRAPIKISARGMDVIGSIWMRGEPLDAPTEMLIYSLP